MNPRAGRGVFLFLGIAVAVFSLYCLRGIMRESDQASLLTGAWNIFQFGKFSGNYYNYDKQFGTYWILASAFWLRSLWGGTWSPVFIADLCTGLVFWSAILFALFQLAARRRIPPPMVLVCFLLTPAIFINAIYANCAIVSAAFVILTSVFLDRRSGLSKFLAFVCFLIAVASRADAVLVAPLLIWLRVPAHGWIKRIFTGLTTWVTVAAAAIALYTGLRLYTGVKQFGAFDAAYYHSLAWKAIPAFLVFGLGPSMLIATGAGVMLLVFAGHARTMERKLFYVCGALCIAIPFLYYSIQLYSPRYLVATSLGAFLFSISPRGTAVWSTVHRRTGVRAMLLTAYVFATLPVFAGMRFPTLSHPRITLSEPTLYPTTDGMHPMGAYAAFMLAMRNSDRVEVDHNQLVWKAAIEARYIPSADGLVHILSTPMYTYLELAVTLDGFQPMRQETGDGRFYADSRTFMRIASGFTGDASLLRPLLSKPSVPVSPSSRGIAIIEFNGPEDSGWAKEILLLNRYFKGNEYRIEKAAVGRGEDDRPFAFFSNAPFTVAAEQASLDGDSGLYFLPGSKQNAGSPKSPGSAQPVMLAVQALPGWMSVSRM